MSYTRYVFEDEGQVSNDRPLGQLLYLTEAEYEGDWPSYAHTHPFAELFYVRSGRGCFWIDENLFPVAQGDLLLINAHVPHTEKSDGSSPLRYLVLGINAIAFESPWATRLKDSPYRFLKLREQAAILPFMDALEQEAALGRPHYLDFCQALYEQLMITIVRENGMDLTFTKAVDIFSTCASVKAYMERNFHLNLSLEDLAARSHVNKFHLAHRFTSAYGVPPIQYLNQLRIKEAQNLLSNSDFSISEISQMLGFSSLSYFGQSFKRALGVSAGVYRKAARARR